MARTSPASPDAEASRKHLAELVAGKTPIAQCYKGPVRPRGLRADPGGRPFGQPAAGRGGLRLAYTARQGDYLRDQAMPDLQRQAKAAGRGLWARPARCSPEVALRLLAPAPVRLSPAEH